MKRKFLVACLLMSLILLTFALPVKADVNDFTVTNFAADYTLTNQDKQGELQIIEHINVEFTDQNHGILRAIPNTYKGHRLQLHVVSISSTSNAPTQFTTYQSNGNTVLQIGNPNQTITGDQEYTIDYSVRNVIGFYKDHDELYWNINGDQWQQPFSKVSVTLHVPSGLSMSNNQPLCYTGNYGSSETNCMISRNGSMITSRTTNGLNSGQTLSIVVGFAKGYFQPSTFLETIAEYATTIIEVALLPIIVFIVAFLWWFKRGRDAKGRGVIVPQYDAPPGLSPLEAGTIIDFKVDNRDITATIIDLAIRGYIKIIETKHDKLIGRDSLSYNLELLKADFSDLNADEVAIMGAIFGVSPTVSAVVDLAVLKNAFFVTATSLRKSVEQSLTNRGYFRSNPLSSTKAVSAFGTIAVVAVIFLAKIIGPALGFGLAISAAIAALFARAMSARTALGVESNDYMRGLKLYLTVAESERIKKLQSPNAPYAANADEPTKTVELFEKLLPYAMVLGVENDWAKQFSSIYREAPLWYSGNWSTFSVLYLTNSLGTGLQTAANSAFSAPKSSGTSGFGGGGFAGGGGGGGGGGGW